ncbi:hypothetical protein GM418_03210 [Maribellus comscasis]|uniref:Alpha/beta hydrolase n=1 Tax=Maribellus comscasis TaxID=2681766 RepID=A0A6I6JIL0_9BACT|nr:hypothetical protein [Maribellus comscasis]QGY42695.1 hypothetical protein GM418_03210 [Maribellus comscasis]
MNSKEAILYIHGSHCTVKNEAIDQLEKDLVNANSFADVSIVTETDISTSETVKKVQLTYHDTKKVKEFYVFEVFWGDLKKSFSEERPLHRFFKSTMLISYWLFSGIWRAIFFTPKMALPLLGSMLLVLGWYLSLLLIFADGLKNYLQDYQQLVCFINSITSWKSWIVWSVFTLLLTVFPTDRIISMAYFSRSYLQDSTLRSKIRERIITVMGKVGKDDRFDSIQILAHSFGSILATEFLSYNNLFPENKKIRVVTLGASLGFIINRARWIGEVLFQAQKNPNVQHWHDYFSYKDWLCSLTPKDPLSDSFESIELNRKVPIGEQLSGHSHQMYFSDEIVLKEILKQ